MEYRTRQVRGGWALQSTQHRMGLTGKFWLLVKIKIPTNRMTEASVEPVITSWTGQRLLLWKGRALFGLSGVSVERCDVCRGCSVLVFSVQQQTCRYCIHLLGFGAPGWSQDGGCTEVQEQSPGGAGGICRVWGPQSPLCLSWQQQPPAMRHCQPERSSPA